MLVFGFCLGLILPAKAAAQRSFRGVTAAATPMWRTEEFSRYLHIAEVFSLEGTEFRVGVSRGRTPGSDWSLLFVRRMIKDGGTIVAGEIADLGGEWTTNSDVMFTGFEAEKFAVKGNLKDRVLFGIVIAGGVAAVKGTLRVDGTNFTGDAKEVA